MSAETTSALAQRVLVTGASRGIGRATMEKQGVTVTGQGAAEYERFLQSERGRWKKMIEDSQVLNG